MAEKRDYYEVLGLQKTCTITEIKSAYRKLARQYHPDVNNGDPQAEERFKEISEAYAVLSNEDKRRQYDRFGFNNSLFDDFDPNSVFSEFGFGDIFDAFFGGGFGRGGFSRGRRQRKRGSDIELDLTIGFKESAYGVKKDIEFKVDKICKDCDGSGSQSSDGIETCSVCGGTGRVQQNNQALFINVVTTATCKNCEGTGKIVKDPCPTCGGGGYKKSKEKLKLDIPAGIHNGDRLKVSGRGNSRGSGSINGDLYVTVKVKPHPEMYREGDDAVTDIKISFAQAALGTKVNIDTLDEIEEIDIKPGIQPNDRIILRSRGFVQLNGYNRGNHVINVKVEIPKKLSEAEKGLLKDYAEGRDELVGDGSSGFFSNLKRSFKK